MDGLRGPLIIHDPNNPYANDFDEELVLTLSDWYHDQSATLVPIYAGKSNLPIKLKSHLTYCDRDRLEPMGWL